MNKRQESRLGRDGALPRLLGERVCLDFVNTVEAPLADQAEEFLHSFPDLARWAWHVGLLTPDQADRLRHEAEDQPDAARATFDRALDLRAHLADIFTAIAQDAPAPGRSILALRAEYLNALSQAELAPAGQGYDWQWDPDHLALDRPLWYVTRSAVDVLTQDDLGRVKQCPGANDCGWLFYDTSRNGSRRWCSMEGCGSRVKMRHHYARRRAVTTTPNT